MQHNELIDPTEMGIIGKVTFIASAFLVAGLILM